MLEFSYKSKEMKVWQRIGDVPFTIYLKSAQYVIDRRIQNRKQRKKREMTTQIYTGKESKRTVSRLSNMDNPIFLINGEIVNETNINKSNLKYIGWKNEYVKICKD